MKKNLFTILAVLVLASLVLSAWRPGRDAPANPSTCCGADSSAGAVAPTQPPAAPSTTDYKPATDKPKKIAFSYLT